VIDLRLAGARALVREMAAAGSLPMLDLSGPCAGWGRTARIALGPAARLLATACARAGEWHAVDRGRGLAASIGFRLEGGGRLPRLISGARLDDPPALVVPASGPGAGQAALADLAAAIPADCPRQTRLLERAAARGRVTVAEVALGHRAVLTGLRTVPL
jgi:hypothetical protein